MDAALKIVTHLPLRELWRDDGLKTTARVRSLTEDDIRSLLRSGNIQFVVVNVGASPCWIQPGECFQFWKNEAQPVASELILRRETARFANALR
jgi:hypothetical protein